MAKKVCIFTGGGSGLALASARNMIEEGAVLLADLREDALKKAKTQFMEMGADVYTFACNVTDPASVNALADYAASIGDIYAVVNCAGVSPANTPRDPILKINALGTVNMVQAFYPRLAEGGVMICFSSKAGYVFDTSPALTPLLPAAQELYTHWNEPDFFDRLTGFLSDVMQVPETYQAGSAYTLSKHFVRYFVKMNVSRFADKGCRILSVSPGSYLTPMHQALIDNAPQQANNDMATIPMKRWGHPYEMAALIRFLCSRGAGYITGVDILADGGGTLTGNVPQISNI